MIELKRFAMMLKTDWKAERMVERMPWKISRMEEMRFVRPSNMPAMVDDRCGLVCVECLFKSWLILSVGCRVCGGEVEVGELVL